MEIDSEYYCVDKVIYNNMLCAYMLNELQIEKRNPEITGQINWTFPLFLVNACI